MKKGLVIGFILLAFFLLWEFPAQADKALKLANTGSATISSISPTMHAEGSFAVTITGNNFKGVQAVTPISATTGTAAENVPFVVNSISKITATVALAADTYYFQVTTKSGTINSPNLAVIPISASTVGAGGISTVGANTPSQVTAPVNLVAGNDVVTNSGNGLSTNLAVPVVSDLHEC